MLMRIKKKVQRESIASSWMYAEPLAVEEVSD